MMMKFGRNKVDCGWLIHGPYIDRDTHSLFNVATEHTRSARSSGLANAGF